MNSAHIEEIAAGLAAREAAIAGAQQEADRVAAEQLQRESAAAARVLREERQNLLAHLEAEQRNCHEHCKVLEQQYRELPDRIAAGRNRLNNLLYQLNEVRKGLL
jgi:septal ring factor EnvC (AmiA/AmiB activator)